MLIQGFNLASADYQKRRRAARLTGAIVLGLALLLVAQLAVWVGLRREGTAVGGRLLAMEQEIRQHQEAVRTIQTGIPAEAVKQYEARVAAYNQILEASAFSWIGLLVELERSVPAGVVLHEIHPDLTTGRVSLHGAARTFDDLSRLLRGLEERTVFRDVFLREQRARTSPAGPERQSGGGPDGLEFAVSLVYQGRAR